MSVQAHATAEVAEGPSVRLTIPAKPEYITLVRLALSGLSRLRPLSEETLGDMKLAVTEACSNSVRHGYGEEGEGVVDVVYELQPDRLVIQVAADGPRFVAPGGPTDPEDPAGGGRRPRLGVADHRRRGRVLHGHEGDSQRAPGRPTRTDRGAEADLPPLQRCERGAVRRRLRLRHHPRPAAGRGHRPLSQLRRPLDLALPPRPLDAECGSARVSRAVPRALRRGHLPPARVRAGRGGAARGVHLAAGDRPTDAEEHGALPGRCGLRRRPVRDPPRAPAAHADLALRSLEGPARGNRQLPAPPPDPT